MPFISSFLTKWYPPVARHVCVVTVVGRAVVVAVAVVVAAASLVKL